MSNSKQEKAQEQFLKETENQEQNEHRFVGEKYEAGTGDPVKVDPRALKIGQFKIDRSSIPYGGLYPASWEFSIRAALGKELSYFSTIDPEDPMSTFEGMNQLIAACVTIVDTEKGYRVSPEKINEFDRVWFVLKVRDLTMPERENQITIEEKCKFCSTVNKVEISSSTLCVKPMSEFAQKYWDAQEGVFKFVTKSFGTIRILTPTIEISKIFMDYVRNLDPQTRDDFFIKRFNFFVHEEDLRIPAKCPEMAYKRFIEAVNQPKLFAMYLKIENNLDLGIDDKLKYHCEACRKELETPVRFPGGFENIFISSDIDSEFV